VPDVVLSELGDLRRELMGKLAELVKKRSGLEGELQALGREIEDKQRALELVEATERQLTGQGRGQLEVEGDGLGASTQVRGLVKRLQDIRIPCCSPGAVCVP
jgi:predicted nuclease with TOPRIM domain